MKSDEQLEHDVRNELDWDPQVQDSPQVAVAVSRGHVTLRGTVRSFHQRRAAVHAARRVDGVFDVDDELGVRLMDELAREDAEVRGAALQALEWNVAVPADRLDVKVDGGHVTLTGTVDWPYQKEAAEDTVSNLVGVVGVRDEIEVTAPLREIGKLADRIEDAFRRLAIEHAGRITIRIADGGVALHGEVTSLAEHDAAIAAVADAPGVQAVHDRLTVSDSGIDSRRLSG
jgi:osmotically-inducible protein OsmY